MSTWTNILRIYLNTIRSGAYTYQEVASAFGTRTAKHRNQLREMAEAARGRVVGSEAARRLRVARAYYSAELGPPKVDEMQKLKSDLDLIQKFIGCNCWKELTVSQAFLLLLVAVEVAMWFFMGECIGKFRIVGYSV